jgi:hypothetical protein
MGNQVLKKNSYFNINCYRIIHGGNNNWLCVTNIYFLKIGLLTFSFNLI